MFSSLRELELLGIKNIRLASQDLHGVILSSETVAEDIWCRILDTVTRKGEHSRRIHSADDKSYLRPDLLEWFKQRVEDDQSRSGRKIYVKRDLPHILTPFRAPMASVCAKRKGQFYISSTHLRNTATSTSRITSVNGWMRFSPTKRNV